MSDDASTPSDDTSTPSDDGYTPSDDVNMKLMVTKDNAKSKDDVKAMKSTKASSKATKANKTSKGEKADELKAKVDAVKTKLGDASALKGKSDGEMAVPVGNAKSAEAPDAGLKHNTKQEALNEVLA